jgi:hypothetical protein
LVVPHDFQNLRGLTFGQRLLLLLEAQNDAQRISFVLPSANDQLIDCGLFRLCLKVILKRLVEAVLNCRLGSAASAGSSRC